MTLFFLFFYAHLVIVFCIRFWFFFFFVLCCCRLFVCYSSQCRLLAGTESIPICVSWFGFNQTNNNNNNKIIDNKSFIHLRKKTTTTTNISLHQCSWWLIHFEWPSSSVPRIYSNGFIVLTPNIKRKKNR